MANSLKSMQVEYDRCGNPFEVLQLRTVDIRSQLDANEVRVRWLASPINPLDINKIEGVYGGVGVRRPPPAEVVGAEAVGRVEAVGKSVDDLKPGDHVIADFHARGGLWRQRAIHDRNELIPIDRRIDLVTAATMLINPPTAYLMLKNYVELSPGDWIIQNSANSGVGRAVIELAKAYGLHTINVIRDRPNRDEMIRELKSLGGDLIFTEEQFREQARTLTKLTGGAKPRIAFNGVGGRSALQISSALDHGGTMVTYGGMSKKAVELSTASLVFRGLKVCGIGGGAFLSRPENVERWRRVFAELQALAIDGKLTGPPVEKWHLQDYRKALERHLAGQHGKQLLVLDDEAFNGSRLEAKL